MQTIRITTSQNIDIDYEIAGVGERILARLIDYAIFFLIIIASLIVGNLINALKDSGILLVVVICIYAALYVFYDLICEVFMNGQCIGKRFMKIKVISIDGGRASLGQYTLRWLFRIIDFTLSAGMGALISAAVSKKCQRIGDMVAGTTLIKTSPRTQINNVAFSPMYEGYIPVFKEATQLKDKDIVLIHEVIESYIKSGNTVVVYNTAAHLKKILAVNVPAGMDDLLFLQTIVKDYSHIIATADAL